MDLEFFTKPSQAKTELANYLNQGSLSLFFGAGISIGCGLPNWEDLIIDMEEQLSQLEGGIKKRKPKGGGRPSADELQSRADEVINQVGIKGDLSKFLQHALYSGMEGGFKFGLLQKELLIAIGALISGSKRGSVSEIITLNYDNIIEWLANLKGLVSRTIFKLPMLEGDEDIKIFHPHGFFPHPAYDILPSNFIILGMDAANRRIGDLGDLWVGKLTNILLSKVCLFVGLSKATFNDRAIAPILARACDELKGDRPTGYWIVTDPLNELEMNAFIRNGVVPVHVNIPDIPNFLLSICQVAAEKNNLVC